MHDTHLHGTDESLPDMLARIARGRSDGELVVAVVIGLLCAGLVVITRRPPAFIAGMGVAVAAFGAWGICDRELGERLERVPAHTHRALIASRLVLTVVGAAAVAFVVFAGLHLVMGTWIS